MISMHAHETSLPLLERVVEQKVNLLPIPGSPLAQLVEDSINPNIALIADDCNHSEDVSVDLIADFTRLNTVNYDMGERSHHDLMLNEVAEAVAASVRITMDTARNKVNPVVTTMIKEIEREFKENVYNVGVNVDLKYSDKQPLLNNELFQKLIANDRAVKVVRDINSTNAFRSLSAEELPAYLKTNVESIDAEVAEWMGGIRPDLIKSVFRNVFENCGGTSNIFGWVRENIDYAITTYLLARNFASNDEIVEHVDNITLDELSASLSEIKAAAALVISGYINRTETIARRGLLVESYPDRHSLTNAGTDVQIQNVVVNKERLDEFFAQGGNIDMVYGNILLEERFYKAEDIIANGRVAERRWETHTLMIRNRAESRKFEVFKRAIISSMAQWVRDADDFAISLEQIMVETRKLVGKLTYADMTNIYDTILTLVDNILFINSDAVKFLRIMNKYSVDQPNLDMRHIATLAATEYTANWVTSMIAAEK